MENIYRCNQNILFKEKGIANLNIEWNISSNILERLKENTGP